MVDQGAGSTINAMQWSAHWSCFASFKFKATCEPEVEKLLPEFLKKFVPPRAAFAATRA